MDIKIPEYKLHNVVITQNATNTYLQVAIKNKP